MAKPIIFVLVGPSGVGKSTLADMVCEKVDGLRYLKTYTTRPRRNDDDDKHYCFMNDNLVGTDVGGIRYTPGNFADLNTYGEFIYGVLKSDLWFLKSDLISCLTYSGVESLKEHGYNVVSIGVLLESPKYLVTRTDRIEDTRRVSYEIMAQEAARCDYVVINDDKDDAAARITRIIERITRIIEMKRRARASIESAEHNSKPWWKRIWEGFIA